MKKIFLLALILVSSLCHAGELAMRLNYTQLFIPLNESCKNFYSLNDETKVCRNSRLYFRAYEIEYQVKGERRSVRLAYIPDRTFRVNRDGDPVPRNHSYATE